MSSPVVGLLESCEPGMWPRLHALCRNASSVAERSVLQVRPASCRAVPRASYRTDTELSGDEQGGRRLSCGVQGAASPPVALGWRGRGLAMPLPAMRNMTSRHSSASAMRPGLRSLLPACAQSLAGFSVTPAEAADVGAKLTAKAEAVMQNHVREAALTRMSRMRDR